jgi:hypothetical protein
MKKSIFLTYFLLVFYISSTRAEPIALYDWAFNVNGTTYEAAFGDILPESFDDSNFNWTSGLGTLAFTFNPGSEGDYSILGFFDHEIVEGTNTFFNEYAFTTGNPWAGQTWEVDEPVFVGDIYFNLLNGELDNTNAVPENSADDVSMAIGWKFHLSADEVATIDFVLDEIMPDAGFYLTHADKDSGDAIFLSSTLTTIPASHPAPEPGTLILIGIGLIAAFIFSTSNGKRKKS